jgi:hypothetical protein
MPHVIYLAIGFPPAEKSSAHRMKATANLLCEQGCDVTVITIARESWMREYGVDATLLNDVDPRIRIVELDLSRDDVDPDIRTYGWFRARHPKRWVKHRRRREQRPFPEPVFGAWRRPLERAMLHIHDAKPASFVLVSTVPYTGLTAAWKLWKVRRVPYAVDFRDAWSLDVIGGGEAFPVSGRRGVGRRRSSRTLRGSGVSTNRFEITMRDAIQLSPSACGLCATGPTCRLQHRAGGQTRRRG